MSKVPAGAFVELKKKHKLWRRSAKTGKRMQSNGVVQSSDYVISRKSKGPLSLEARKKRIKATSRMAKKSSNKKFTKRLEKGSRYK